MNLKDALALGLQYVKSERILAEHNCKHAVDPELREYYKAKANEYREAEVLIREFSKSSIVEIWERNDNETIPN